MKRIAMMLALALLTTFVFAGQDKTTDKPKADINHVGALPAVDEILDKFVKAIGGKEVIQKVTSRVSKGSFEIEAMNISGSFQVCAKAPNKNAIYIDIPDFGIVNNIFDGTKAWLSTPLSGLHELEDVELAAQKRDADFYLPLNLKTHYPKMTVEGKEKIGAGEAYVVKAIPTEGGSEKLYFDANSGLLVRHDAERDTTQGKMAMESYYENYKDVDGVKIAHTMRQVTAVFSITIKLTEIKHNVLLEDAKFNKPTN